MCGSNRKNHARVSFSLMNCGFNQFRFKSSEIKPINNLKSSAMQLVQLKSYLAIVHNFWVPEFNDNLEYF